MRILLALLLISLSISSFAGDILLGQVSNHFGYCQSDCIGYEYRTKVSEEFPNGQVWQYGQFRETHPLIGYSVRKYTVLLMKNSFDRVSVSVLRNFSYELTSNLRPYASVGIATGYDRAYEDSSVGMFTPVAMLSLDIHPSNDKFGLVINWLPTVLVSAGFRFKY